MKRVYLGIATIFIFLLIGCATTTTDQVPPEWIFSNPPTDANMYFVGTGTSLGDVSEAEDAAKSGIIGDIFLYVGSNVSTNVTAEVQSTLDTFKASMTENIMAEGNADLSGFIIQDRWIKEGPDGITVYLLGAYNYQEIRNLKNQFEEQIREREAAISGPELEGDNLAAQGDLFGAVMKYLEAAANASVSDIDNAEIKFQRNMNKAISLLSDVSLIPLTSRIEGFAGVPFSSSMDVKVVKGSGLDDTPLAGVPVRVTYKQLGRANRLITRGANFLTNEEGLVSFDHPVPDFVGESTVTFSIDLSSYLEPLESVPSNLMSSVLSFDDMLSSLNGLVNIVSSSNAKEIPMGIVILDADTARAPYGTNDSAAGVVESLSAAGFDVKVLGLSPEELLNLSDSGLVDRIQNEFGNDVERIVFGIVNISDFSDVDNNYTVKVTGLLKVADLETGDIIFSRSMIKNARGTNVNSVISTAFRQLGNALGETMVNDLW